MSGFDLNPGFSKLLIQSEFELYHLFVKDFLWSVWGLVLKAILVLGGVSPVKPQNSL